ncbi:MAG: YtxH domain-containing protein [Aequorivita sp.]
MSNKKGLLAMLGVAAAGGALAFWKYKTMTPEEKQNLKDKANKTGKRIKEKAGEMEDTISGKYDQLKNTAKRGADDLKGEANDLKQEVKDITS